MIAIQLVEPGDADEEKEREPGEWESLLVSKRY